MVRGTLLEKSNNGLKLGHQPPRFVHELSVRVTYVIYKLSCSDMPLKLININEFERHARAIKFVNEITYSNRHLVNRAWWRVPSF